MPKVLMLHRVLPQKEVKAPNAYFDFGTLITQEYLDALLVKLKSEGFQFATISELSMNLNEKRLIALTFDDGYSDNYTHALPLLESHNATATFYPVVLPCMNNSVLPLDHYYHWVDDSNLEVEERENYIRGAKKREFYWLSPEEQILFINKHLNNSWGSRSGVRYMTAKELRELAERGFEIGSHGLSHALFTAGYMNEEKKRFELIESKRQMENAIGLPILSFCFPSGYYDQGDIQLVSESGYKSVVIIRKKNEAGCNSIPAFERLFVKPNAIDELLKELSEK
jgi:peptidoglycan/xylan/chitin deacetylase (PgdA/CDA1 family)